MNTLHAIGVFCGANPGIQPVYVETAVALGQELGRRGLRLVYGGGSVGLMGALARAAHDAGAPVVGVIPGRLTAREIMGHKIGDLIVVETMHERKAKMAALADGFIALPGGLGTMDELAEALTWGQLGIHAKPIGLLNINGYYDALLQWFDHGVAEGFIRPHHRKLVVEGADPAGLIEQLQAHVPPPGIVKWMDLDKA
jgi:uncharacterized protein (TIGR00730 family)